MRKIALIGMLVLGVLLLALLVSSCGPDPDPTATTAPTSEAGQVLRGVPPNVPHHLVGRSECTTCHESGIAQVPEMPRNHAVKTDELCMVCHKAVGQETHEIPGVPHTLTSRSQCLLCHATGIASAPAAPQEMASLSNDHCLLCHWTRGQAPANGTHGSPTPGPGLQPPAILHATEGRAECLTCHEGGLPEDHATRTSDTCVVCHQKAEGTTSTPTPTSPHVPRTGTPPTEAPTRPVEPAQVPHTPDGRSDCLTCHAASVPQDHADRDNTTCTMCHEPAPVSAATSTPVPPAETPTAVPPAETPTEPAPTTPPTDTPPTATPTKEPVTPAGPSLIPHTLEERSDCLLCHAASVPEDHADRSSETCVLCHKQEGS